MSNDAVFDVTVPVEFSGSGTSGEGVMRTISRKGARIEAPQVKVGPDATLSLAFRFFETSTPIRVPVKVLEHADGGFAAEFAGMQVVTRHLLRLMINKLRYRTEADRSALALLRHPN